MKNKSFVLLVLFFLLPLASAITPKINYTEPTPQNNSIWYSDSIIIKAEISLRPYKCLLQIGNKNTFTNYTMLIDDFNCIYTLPLNPNTAYNFTVFAFDNQGNTNQSEIRLIHAGNVTTTKTEDRISLGEFSKIGERIWKYNPVVGWFLFFAGIWVIYHTIDYFKQKKLIGG